MTVKIGINGFGRIGRLFLRNALKRTSEIQVVAINDPFMTPNQMAYFLKFDTIHGKFKGKIQADQNFLYVEQFKIAIFREPTPGNIPWSKFGTDIVIEASGKFTRKNEVAPHINKGGAKFVLITAPSQDAKTFIFGVNEHQWRPEDQIFSMGSATANAAAPLLRIINERFGIQNAFITAIQSLTAQQKPVDSTIPPTFRETAQDFNMFRLGRGGQSNIIPSSNTVGWPIIKVLPEFQGKLSGVAFRVPTSNVATLDLTLNLQKPVSKSTFESFLREHAEGKLKNIISFTQDEVVSSDFNHTPFSFTYDSKASIFLQDKHLKIVGWFDNEWGYTSRLVDLILFTAGRSK